MFIAPLWQKIQSGENRVCGIGHLHYVRRNYIWHV